MGTLIYQGVSMKTGFTDPYIKNLKAFVRYLGLTVTRLNFTLNKGLVSIGDSDIYMQLRGMLVFGGSIPRNRLKRARKSVERSIRGVKLRHLIDLNNYKDLLYV
jgi:hypothetical protein